MERIFAEVQNGKVTNVVVTNTPLSPNWVEITGINPLPGIGWSFSNGVFTGPDLLPSVPEPVKTTPFMSHYGFLSRLTAQQRLAIRKRTNATDPEYDPNLDDAMFLFNNAETINVNLTETQQLVGYLALVGLVQQSQVPALLAPIEVTSPHARFS